MLRNVCFRTHVIPSANSNFDPARGFHSTTAPFCFEACAPTVHSTPKTVGDLRFESEKRVKLIVKILSIGVSHLHQLLPSLSVFVNSQNLQVKVALSTKNSSPHWMGRSTAWYSEIGSLTSLDAPEFHASSDVREPISLYSAVDGKTLLVTVDQQGCRCGRLN